MRDYAERNQTEVEQQTEKEEKVIDEGRRTPLAGGCGSLLYIELPGGVPERSKGSDCKSDGFAFAGSNPAPSMRV